MSAFSFVTLSGATTYWRRETRAKKGTLHQAKGVNRTTYWRRYIPTIKRYPTTSCKRIYNKVPAYIELNKIFFKQLRGIKLHKRRSVSDNGYLKKTVSTLSRNQKVIFIFFFLPTPSLQREKFNSVITVLCCTKNIHSHSNYF